MSEWAGIEEYVTTVCNALQMVERMKNCVNCDHYRVCGIVMDRKARRANDYSACESWKLADEGPAAKGGERLRTAWNWRAKESRKCWMLGGAAGVRRNEGPDARRPTNEGKRDGAKGCPGRYEGRNERRQRAYEAIPRRTNEATKGRTKGLFPRALGRGPYIL